MNTSAGINTCLLADRYLLLFSVKRLMFSGFRQSGHYVSFYLWWPLVTSVLTWPKKLFTKVVGLSTKYQTLFLATIRGFRYLRGPKGPPRPIPNLSEPAWNRVNTWLSSHRDGILHHPVPLTFVAIGKTPWLSQVWNLRINAVENHHCSKALHAWQCSLLRYCFPCRCGYAVSDFLVRG